MNLHSLWPALSMLGSVQWPCLYPLDEPELTDPEANQTLFLGSLDLEWDRSRANSFLEPCEADGDYGREAGSGGTCTWNLHTAAPLSYVRLHKLAQYFLVSSLYI